jgi:hypothetical protein
MSPETLRLYASIMEKLRRGEVDPRYSETHKGIVPPGEIAKAAAAALRFQADAIERTNNEMKEKDSSHHDGCTR